MSDKGKGGVKNLKKWVTSFMNGPSLISWPEWQFAQVNLKNPKLRTPKLSWTIDNPFYLIIGLICVILSLKSDWYDHYHIMRIWWCVIDMKIQTRFSWLQKFHHIWEKKDSEIFRIGTILCSFVFTYSSYIQYCETSLQNDLLRSGLVQCWTEPGLWVWGFKVRWFWRVQMGLSVWG